MARNSFPRDIVKVLSVHEMDARRGPNEQQVRRAACERPSMWGFSEVCCASQEIIPFPDSMNEKVSGVRLKVQRCAIVVRKQSQPFEHLSKAALVLR